jgi:hypothetical protein
VLAQALAEGFFPDPGDALEADIALQPSRRKDAHQITHGYHAVKGWELSALNLLLQRSACHTHQPRRPRQAKSLLHALFLKIGDRENYEYTG